MLICDLCYIFVTSDRAPGNCCFTATIACENIRLLSLAAKSEEKRMFSQAAATNAVLVNILAELKERQITATACNLKRTTRFFSKVGYVLQCVTMLAQSATRNLQSVKVQGLQNY